jgi:hypothetical protein
MGAVKIAIADTGDTSMFDSVSSCTAVTTYKRTGTHSLRAGGAFAVWKVTFSGLSEGYARVCIGWSTSVTVHYTELEFQNAVSQTHFSIDYSGTSAWARVYVNGGQETGVLAGTIPLQVNDLAAGGRFVVFEVHWIIDAVNGVIELKIDGSLVLTYSGDTTYPGASDAAVAIIKGGDKQVWSISYIDDMIVRDDTWPGRGGIYLLAPNAGSAVEDWTASAGNPEDCVDDKPPSFSDYIYTNAATDATQHLFGVESLPIAPESISAVAVMAVMKSDYAADVYAKTLVKSGATLQAGSSNAISNVATPVIDYYDTNPDTAAAWTYSDIESMEIGVETDVP